MELLDVPRMFAQLVGLERRARSGGRDQVDHLPGGHDDLANAAAGALGLTSKAGGSDLIFVGGRIRHLFTGQVAGGDPWENSDPQ